jgi:hypothetical protein
MTGTTNLGLKQPTVGADSNGWGGDLNDNFGALDDLWVNIGDVAFGSAAVENTSFFAQAANNLSDLSNATTARTNLGLGTAATANTGTGTGEVPVNSASNMLTSNLTGDVTGNCSGSSGSCTGNAATASSAATVDFAAGVAIQWDGSNIRFFIGSALVAYISPTEGFVNNV